jgi:hypothetical protein
LHKLFQISSKISNPNEPVVTKWFTKTGSIRSILSPKKTKKKTNNSQKITPKMTKEKQISSRRRGRKTNKDRGQKVGPHYTRPTTKTDGHHQNIRGYRF